MKVNFSCDCSEEEFHSEWTIPITKISLKNNFFVVGDFEKRIFRKKKLRQVSNDIMSNCINIIIGIRSIFVKIILISALKTI